MTQSVRLFVAEAIGTLILVVGGPGTAIIATSTFEPSGNVGRLGVALAFGLSLLCAAYAIGSMFASTEYNLFPYFMVGYVCALYRIASKPVETEAPATEGGRNGRVTFPSSRRSEYAWSR